jgi:hypothetical protein
LISKKNGTIVENPLIELVHQVIQNMIHTRDLNNQQFEYINPWDEILSSMACAIHALYHLKLGATPASQYLCRVFEVK